MKIFAETTRLLLREILHTDLDSMYEMDSDTEVHMYLGNKPVSSKEQIESVITFIRQQYIENGIGRWAMIEKATSNFIGWTGLKLVKETINNRTNYHDLGYRLNRKYWGKGYATEGAIASIDYGFNELRLKKIIATAQVDNIASNKIISKLGFEFLETFKYEGQTTNWYELDSNIMTGKDFSLNAT